jgi:hypothetical protein
VLLAAAELGLQLRAQWLTGQSVFSLLAGKSSFVRDPGTGLRLLRPSVTIRGQRTTMHTNRHGLRGPDFPIAPPAAERRVVMLGASTIMGTYASADDRTSSAQLERQLAANLPGVRVINAGIAGLGVDDQVTLFERRLRQFEPDLVVWYPGINDFACRVSATAGPVSRPLEVPSLPRWLLLPDLVSKNTAWLRRGRQSSNLRSEPRVDLPGLEQSLRSGIESIRNSGADVVLVTSARSFRRDMSDAELTRRTVTALSPRPCYTPATLLDATESFDTLLERVARYERVALVDASSAIPPSIELFGDSTHLSDHGEEELAALIAATIAADPALTQRLRP